ncbi:MAG TPA: hypothetical protein VIV63_11420 [Steroidobacteraceae bacterium]
MKRRKEAAITLHDYRMALQNAVTWLGERYLLAEPVVRRNTVQQPFFVEPKRWHEVTQSRGPGSRRH